MKTSTAKNTIVLGLVGALTMAAASPTWAAPVPSNTAAVKSAAPIPTTEVRFRHRGFGPGAAIGGLALGLAGAAFAAPYYYGSPAYDYGYSYGPEYSPGYAYRPEPYAWGPGWHRQYHHGW